ncbi:hypothetical protein ABLS81_23070, partial [Pseudomonas aeruginosa]
HGDRRDRCRVGGQRRPRRQQQEAERGGQAIEHDRADEPIDDNTYFVMRNAGGAVFVKHGPFFVSQGGLTEDWGKNWKRIRTGSLKHARQVVGEELLPRFLQLPPTHMKLRE